MRRRAGQHLWRHHALHDDRRRDSGGLQDRSVSTCRWWSGWKEPKSKKAGEILADSGVDIITADGLTDAAKKVVAAVSARAS